MEKYTDQTFFYKQTPVNYDGIAKFTSIKGNTLVWNQLVQNGNFESTTGWKAANTNYGTISASGNILTYTVASQQAGPYNYRIQQQNDDNLGIPVGHKVLVAIDFNPSEANNGSVQLQSSVGALDKTAISFTGVEANKWTHLSTIYTIQSASQYIAFYLKLENPQTVGATFKFRNFIIIDLTKMFGSGNEPTTVDEFTSLFPLPYYDFNQGTLIPFSGNGIKTVGKNKLKMPSSATLNGITFNVGADGQSQITGTATAQTDLYLYGASGRYDDMGIMSSTYTFSCRKDSTTTGLNFFLVGQQAGTRIGVELNNTSLSQTVALDGSDKYRVFMRVANGATINTKVALQLELGSTARDYEPYIESITDLPISNYFPTGMKSAGNVYDELTESKAITRVGMVNLGDLDWSYNTTYSFFWTQGQSYLQANENYICAKYTFVGVKNDSQMGSSPDKTVGIGTGLNIKIKDSSYTDPTAFKTAMSNVYLFYELKNYVETDAEDIFYKFYADGTEEILPVNGSSPETSPIIADIEYYDSTEGDSLYRRFWLINGDGERWDLTDKEFKSFLNNPTGLGFRKTIEVTRYGEKANKNNEIYDFPQPSGELLFYDTYNSTRYDKYNKFIRFLMSQPITLYYMIPVSYISGIANIFTLNCDVTEVQKTESKTDHILTSSIVFNGLGFYEGDEISVNGTTDTYTLTNEGDFPVGFEITVEGSLTKPYITLSQDGELYGEAKFVGTQAYNSLYLNSNDGEQNIILQQGGSVIPNPLSYQDLSISNGSIYVTFVKLAKGVSELSIGVESGSITNVNIKYSPKYRSV